jgi:outer membrane protein assembly factor BamD
MSAMPNAKLSTLPNTLRFLAATGCCFVYLVMQGCASSATDPTTTWSPNKLYQEAKDEASSGSWDKAISYYEKLEGRAAGTPLAQQAEIEKAYAQYKSGEALQALASLDRFIKLHPGSPGLDYAYYLKGIINFNDDLGFLGRFTTQDLSERDQKASKESYDAFKVLVDRFPDSKYASDAVARMTYLVGSLARYEVNVARYYYSRGAYVAAINRAQAAITDYREVPAVEDALWILIQSYDQLGMKDLASDSRRVMVKSFPKGKYANNTEPVTERPWWKLW